MYCVTFYKMSTFVNSRDCQSQCAYKKRNSSYITFMEKSESVYVNQGRGTGFEYWSKNKNHQAKMLQR